MPSSLISTFGDWHSTMKISGLCGIGSADWSSFAAMFASDCAHPHPPIVCWRLSSLSVAKSQLFLAAIARNSLRIARCSGMIPSLARMASIPSLIPRNAPSMATPFPGFNMNRTLVRFVPPNNQVFEIDRHMPLDRAHGTNLSHLCQTAGRRDGSFPTVHTQTSRVDHCAIPGTHQREIFSREREKSMEPGSRAFNPSI